MRNLPQFARPPFSQALAEWKKILAQKNLPADIVWIFEENLCFEKDAKSPGGFKLGFQTQITPPPIDAEQIAYEEFSGTEARIVFYGVGTSAGKSVCAILCDERFEPKTEADGFIRRDDWLMSFHPGNAGEIEEITDEKRWRRRAIRHRPLHDLDFCMTLQAIHEVLAHGRVLTAYEQYALKVLGSRKK
jgi:hypothetical protein